MNSSTPLGPEVKGFFDEDTNTVSYVIKDPTSAACAIVDSVLGFDPAAGRTFTTSADQIIRYVKDRRLTVEWIIETHVHADHLSAAPYIQATFGGRLGIGAKITLVQEMFGKIFNAGTEFARDGSQFDRLFEDGDCFEIGALHGHVMHTPGHTPACMTWIIGDAAFIGDTLFMPDYGTARCDFPGGDARALFRSIRRIFALPAETRLFVCHDYLPVSRTRYAWETTVQDERINNVHAHEGIDEDTFVRIRHQRDSELSMPRLILPSIQVNMRAGHLPKAENNGLQYLKIPINVL